MQFNDLTLNKEILRALTEEGYQTPTAIQAAAIPAALAGKDLLATAQTGTGKTAVFSLPILQRLASQPPKGCSTRALVLAPTRELALQIDASFRKYGRYLPYRTGVVLGGVSKGPQIRALRRSEIVVATPGRLLDLWRQGHAHLKSVEVLVLDEADRMLDMGFCRDVRAIIAAMPRDRQTMMFSATLSPEATELSSDILQSPVVAAVTPSASVPTEVLQQVMYVEPANKRTLLTEILNTKGIGRALVFTRTKHGANKVTRRLLKDGIAVAAIHSNKSQSARQRSLGAFEGGRIRVLVATDIASRGINVVGISHVINYEVPNDPTVYVHRIGRTARAGTKGIALSLCSAKEVPLLGGIERLTRSALLPVIDHPFHSAAIAALREGKSAPSAPRQPTGQKRRFGRKKVAVTSRSKQMRR